MQDRYEIRGKLGQGGLGAVYKAYDKTLQREVAIKRISTSEDEPHNEEATRQMTQETGALAALQHPHIVTIYDVGTDDEGPFVVMELLKGKTIDEIVEETAPLTWKDFREFAMQVQEGLIAAQDLDLVHRDLKPSNLMLNWLPSGKFQVKIVDFGLARFAAEPALQEVTEGDAVYGSIFFMSPEQFERKKIDTRTDMYAMGCVYYFALTGEMPFRGETGPQVMAAHLEHRVVPLAEIRPDLPAWVCDWVMWHMNRDPENRPENTREALQNFIELDVPTTQSMSNG
ncbi:MAG: serine/threonine-protein kinase, partial [Verrucomicrobiota bacterium]